MTTKESEFRIDNRLEKYCKIIYDFNKEMGDIRGTPERISIITGFMITYGRLTQRQIKVLTKYSLSTISEALNMLINARIINKSLIPGTHTFEYSIANNIVDTNRNSLNMIHLTLGKIVEFLNQIKSHLENLPNKNLSGYNVLKQQIDFMINDFLSYSSLVIELIRQFDVQGKLNKVEKNNGANSGNKIEKMNKYLAIKDNLVENSIKNKLEFEQYSEPAYHNIIIEIEKKIIQILTKTLFPPTRGPSKSLILPYFFTRGMLTQNDLKKLTKLSAGAISQGLSNLIDENIIEVSPVKRNKDGKKLKRVYRIRSISIAASYRLYKLFSTIIENSTTFYELEQTLEEKSEKIKKLKGYDEILSFAKDINKLSPMYENFVGLLGEILNK